MERLLAELVLLCYIACSYAESCVDHLRSCPEGQICIEKTGLCGCDDGMVLVDGTCEKSVDPGAGGGHTATVVAVVLVALALIAAALVLVVRRYQLVDWVRRQIDARRNHDVLYEDVMIGQDDPPLSL